LVNPSMQATADTATLAKMSLRGQFSVSCKADGPFALDNAIKPRTAKIKNMGGPVAGEADILICADIETSNMLAKSLVYFAGIDLAGVFLGEGVFLRSKGSCCANQPGR
jgi:phosphotransacetylase